MPGACRPRQMLPPPTTTAVWIPRSTTSPSCRASSEVASVLMPYPVSAGANASPESFSRTRPYMGRVDALDPVMRSTPSMSVRPTLPGSACVRRDSFAKLVPDEAPNRNFLSELGRGLVQELLHGLGVVLHEILPQQD